MRLDFERTIKSFITSIVMTLVFNHAVQAGIKQPIWPSEGENANTTSRLLKYLKKKFLKNILKIQGNGKAQVIAQHGSHSSHASHSSHYSSYNSRGANSDKGTSQASYTMESVYTTKNNEGAVSSNKQAGRYELGERVLKKGSFGKDVDELVEILDAHKLLDKNKTSKQNGYSLFNDYVVQAVKRFQKSQKLSPTGLVDALTARKIMETKKKDK